MGAAFFHPLGSLTWTADGAWDLNSRLSALPIERGGVPLRVRGILFSIKGTINAAAGGVGLLAGDVAAVMGRITVKDSLATERIRLHGSTLREINAADRGYGATRGPLDSAAIAAAAGANQVEMQRLLLDFAPPSAENPEDYCWPAALLRGASVDGTFNPAAAFRNANDTITAGAITVQAILEPYPTAPNGSIKFKSGMNWTLLEEHTNLAETSIPLSPGGVSGLMLIRHNLTTTGVGLLALANGDLDTVILKAGGDLVHESVTDEELLAMADVRAGVGGGFGAGVGSIEGGDSIRSIPILWPMRARIRDYLEGVFDFRITGDGGKNTFVVRRYAVEGGARSAKVKAVAAPGSDGVATAPSNDPRFAARLGTVYQLTRGT